MSATSSTSPSTGTVVDGRYALESLLGEGTFGGVWRARDTRLAGRPVAMKFLKIEFLEHAGAVSRFDAEADALAQVSHPNIVGVIDRGTWNHQRYIVMELVEGRTLSAWVRDHRESSKVPDIAAALGIFDQLCAGLEAAHAVRSPGPIVHRDLKPDNVLLRVLPGGEVAVKVLDFGIAQLGRRKGTQTGALMGTPLYMAPEQAMGQVAAIGPWTDVFALGVLLVEMLTTDVQASADEPWWGTALQRQGDIRALLDEKRDDVPAPIWDVAARCLRSQGSERYADAGALRAAIRQAAMKAFGASSPSQLPWGRLAAVVVVGAIALAVGIVAVLIVLDGRKQSAQATPHGARSRPHAQPARPLAAVQPLASNPALSGFVDRWERLRRAEPGAEPVERFYSTSLKYHGSGSAPDFAKMARDTSRMIARGGTFSIDRARSDWSEESPDDDAVPPACRAVPSAAGAVLKVRAWATELSNDRNADIGCPRLEGRYLLRMRETPAGPLICHETWSIDEGICASCPTAPLCQHRRP